MCCHIFPLAFTSKQRLSEPHLPSQFAAVCNMFLFTQRTGTAEPQFTCTIMPQFLFSPGNILILPVANLTWLLWRVYSTLLPSYLSDVNKCLCLFSTAEQSLITDLIASHRALVCPLWWGCCLLSFFQSLEIEKNRERERVNGAKRNWKT